MFVEACAKSIKYTKPLVISVARVDGTVESGLGTYVMVNREGWAITAAHCVLPFVQFREHTEKMREIDRHNTEHPDDKKEYDPKWLTAQSLWWGDSQIRMEKLHYLGELDLAIVKLINVPQNFVNDFPTFKSAQNIKQGMSLCRIICRVTPVAEGVATRSYFRVPSGLPLKVVGMVMVVVSRSTTLVPLLGAGVASHCSGVGRRCRSPLVAIRIPFRDSSIPPMCWSPKVPENVLSYINTLNALELTVVM